MTDREKLIELIQNAVGGCARNWAEAIADHLLANGVTVQEWIPVTERLPNGEALAISMVRGPTYKEQIVGWVYEDKSSKTGYACESEGTVLFDVTHWMQPQPPKERVNENRDRD